MMLKKIALFVLGVVVGLIAVILIADMILEAVVHLTVKGIL